MIGRHNEQGLFVAALFLQVGHQVADQFVDVRDLQEVTLVGLGSRPIVLQPPGHVHSLVASDYPRDPRLLVHRVKPSIRQVFPARMGKHRVEEVKPRAVHDLD